MNASQKVQVVSSLPRPETTFWHQQGHQRASASTGANAMIQPTDITVDWVEHQKTKNKKDLENDFISLQM